MNAHVFDQDSQRDRLPRAAGWRIGAIDQNGGRFIYLEGSYTNSFSGNPHPTPYYEYNQILYRLDLADERLRVGE